MTRVIFVRVVLTVVAISLAAGLGVGLARAQTLAALFDPSAFLKHVDASFARLGL